MFKLFNKTEHSKKGFTLAELMVVMTILLLIGGLTGQLIRSVYSRYLLVEKQYIIQTEVEHLVRDFQNTSSRAAIAGATNVDLFYEDPANVELNHILSSCSELGTITELENGDLKFSDGSRTYTYIFTYKGYIYVLNSQSLVASRYYFTDPVKMDISFGISVNAFATEASVENDVNVIKEVTNADHSYTGHEYLETGISVSVASADEYLPAKYSLDTSFAFENMRLKGQKVNINSENGYFITNSNSAGWDKGNLTGYPTGALFDPELSYPNLSKAANVIKFISYFDSKNPDFTAGGGGGNTGFNCASRFLMAGTNVESGVLQTLREFRDNTLKGTVVGDMIIDKYYNEWSPAIIELGSKSDTAKTVMQTALKDVAYLIEMSK